MVSRSRDKYQAYYTNSTFIVGYMIKMLEPGSGHLVLEPSAGEGAFVEAVISSNRDLFIEAYELNETSIDHLRTRFGQYSQVSIVHANTLLQGGFGPKHQSEGVYDRIVANPPYGGWLEYEERAHLKKLYPDLYVKETYSLFLARCVRLLKPGGRLVFIIPETFLKLHRHKRLRKMLLTECKIDEVAIFPSHFFPSVSFGYAKLCIISLERCASRDACLDHVATVKYGFSAPKMLTDKAVFDGTLVRCSQREVYQSSDHAFLLHQTTAVTNMLNSSSTRLGEIADCVTGFYSGDDVRFLRHNYPAARNAKRYQQITDEEVTPSPTAEEKATGIAGSRAFVPIRKGGSAEYVAREKWYIDWSRTAVRHYKTDKKARYQNPQYYFRYGIGVPMVSSNRITAALIRHELFDQSIVGIFPKDSDLIPYLLGLLNSATGNVLVRTINSTANNSANYLKKIPILVPSRRLLRSLSSDITDLITEIDDPSRNVDLNTFREYIDRTFCDIYGF